MNRTLLCALALFVCAPASAQINKCVDARGKVSYQEQPCPGAKIERIAPSSQPAEQGAAQPQPAGAAADEREKRRRECVQAREQLKESWSNRDCL
jgi:Domain of unknown function (DUF4124)